MNPAHRGSAVAFSVDVKDHLFPKLKFLKGTNASLDFSMDATSILNSAFNKNGKLKHNCIYAYNDLYENDFIGKK
jgi:hypothetical protein